MSYYNNGNEKYLDCPTELAAYLIGICASGSLDGELAIDEEEIEKYRKTEDGAINLFLKQIENPKSADSIIDEEEKKLIIDALRKSGYFTKDVVESEKKQEELEQYINYVNKKIKKFLPTSLPYNRYSKGIIKIIRKDADSLQYVTDNMKKFYPEIVLEAVKQNPRALKFAPDDLKNAKINEEAVPCTLEELEKAIDILKKVIAASNKEETDLKNALEKIEREKKYKEIVLTAIKQDGCCLEHVPAYQNDPEVVLEALEQNPEAFKFVPPKTQVAHPKIVKNATERYGSFYTVGKFISEDFIKSYSKDYLEILLNFTKSSFEDGKGLLQEIQKEYPEILLEVVKDNSKEIASSWPIKVILEKAQEIILKEHSEKYIEIIKSAIIQDPRSLKFILDSFIENNPEKYKEITLTGVSVNKWPWLILSALSENFALNHPDMYKEIALVAVKRDGLLLEYVKEEFKENYANEYNEIKTEASKHIHLKDIVKRDDLANELIKYRLDKKFRKLFYTKGENKSLLERIKEKHKGGFKK